MSCTVERGDRSRRARRLRCRIRNLAKNDFTNRSMKLHGPRGIAAVSAYTHSSRRDTILKEISARLFGIGARARRIRGRGFRRRPRKATIGAVKPPIGLAFLAAHLLLAPGLAQSRPAPPLELVRSIPLEKVHGRIDHMAVDRGGSRLLVAALENNTLEVVDLAKGVRSRQIEGLGEPQGVCALPSGKIVVASGGDGTVRIFDESLKVTGTIDSLSDADNVRFEAAAGRVWVGYGSGALVAIDPEKAKKVATIPLDAHPESFQLETKGSRIFVNVPKAKHV